MSFPVINSKLWTRTDQYKIRITITKLLAGYPAANRPDPDIRPPDNPVRDTSNKNINIELMMYSLSNLLTCKVYDYSIGFLLRRI